MNKLLYRLVAAGTLLLLAASAQGGSGTAYVMDFFNDLRTLEADFDQQVVDSEGNIQQSSQGHMWVQRPGRFRWDYKTPYRQQVVADGERLWSYDEDLEQVTVQNINNVLTSTPAMLLSGARPLEDVFLIEELEPDSADRQIQLSPISDDSNVLVIILYFNGDTLVRMRALDSFGYTTTFSFASLQRNREIDQQLFRFNPPVGTDVIGDAG